MVIQRNTAIGNHRVALLVTTSYWIFIQFTKPDLRNCLVNELGVTFKPRSEEGAKNVQCLIYHYYSRKERLSPLLTCKQLLMQIWHQATKRLAIRGLGLNCWALSAKWFVLTHIKTLLHKGVELEENMFCSFMSVFGVLMEEVSKGIITYVTN